MHSRPIVGQKYWLHAQRVVIVSTIIRSLRFTTFAFGSQGYIGQHTHRSGTSFNPPHGDPIDVLERTVDFEYLWTWLVEWLGHGNGNGSKGRPAVQSGG